MNHDCDQAIETRAFQTMDISKASSLGDVGEVEGGLEITLDLPAMKAELTRVQAKCAIRGLAQVDEPSNDLRRSFFKILVERNSRVTATPDSLLQWNMSRMTLFSHRRPSGLQK